jgi:hypothetical protein
MAEQYVTVRFDACAQFVTDDACTGGCADCGWLEGDHPADVAPVHQLPSRRDGARPAGRAPQRKAS